MKNNIEFLSMQEMTEINGGKSIAWHVGYTCRQTYDNICTSISAFMGGVCTGLSGGIL